MANVVEVIFQGVDQITRNTNQINQSLAAIQRVAVRAGSALAAAFSVREIGRATDTMILVENRIRLVTESVEELNTVQEALFRVAQETRSAFAPTVELYARVARSTRDLGLSQQDIIDLTETVNQTIQISGATAQEASAGVIQFAQALASGELRGEELRSVMEQLSGLSLVLARGLGVTIGELRTMAEAGELTTQKIIEVLREQAPQVAAEFEKITPTIEGAFQTVQNSLTQFIADLGEASGATEGLISFLGDLSGDISTFGEAVFGSLEATDELTRGMQNLATVSILTAAALQVVLNSLAAIPRLGKAGVEEVSGFVAALAFLAKGDLDAAATASREAMADASKSSKLIFADVVDNIVATSESASERISQIFLKAFRDGDGGVDLDKRREAVRKLLDELANAEKIQNSLARIDLELATFGQTATEVELYKLELLGATDAQLQLAQGALNLISVLEREKTVLDRIKELEFDAATFDMNAVELELYKLELAGATEAQLEMAQGLLNLIATMEDSKDEAEEWARRLESIADEAARSMERAFSDFFFDPFQDGLEGMVVGFLNAIRRMLADEAAIKFFELLFGKKDKAGGLLGDIFKGLGGIFGGGGGTGPLGPPRAHGGFTTPGKFHRVNEREPEFLLTRGRSEVVPLSKMAGAGGGSRVFSPTTTFQLMTAPLSRDQLEQFSEQREEAMFAKFKRMLRDDGLD